MQPIAPLMIEHRLIERSVPLMKQECERIGKGGSVDPNFIAEIVDFFRTYADRCHHGKEEDLLFRALKKKNLSAEHKKTMEELLSEHRYGRETVGKLAAAQDAGEVAAQLDILIDLYPRHIEKEDRHFFIPVMDYFSQREKDDMLKQMWEFDRKLIHEKYYKIMEGMERGKK